MTSSEKYWKRLFVASFFIGAMILARTLDRPADGDDSANFYIYGLSTWADRLASLFAFPDPKISIYNRHRPFGIELWIKFLWELGFTAKAYKVINWLVNYAASLSFAFGMTRIISLGIKLRPEVPWAIACLIWWATPLFLITTGTFYPAWVEVTLGGALVLIANPGVGKAKWIRLGLAALLGFFACNSHEKGWMMLPFVAGWLALLQYRKKIQLSGPKFWWPLALLGFYLLFYRSFSSAQYKDVIALTPKLVFTWDKFWTNCSYYILVLINGVFSPLPHWLGADKQSFDITLLETSLPFLLTIGGFAYGIYWAFKNRVESTLEWKLAATGLLGMVVVFTVPFWFAYFRLNHYLISPLEFLLIWLVVLVGRGEKFCNAAVVFVLLGTMMTSAHVVENWNWIEFNAQNNKRFTDRVLAREDLKDCSSDQPCCIHYNGRVGGYSEWEMNWNAGAPKWPKFYPDNWQGLKRSCVKTVNFD
jgi:hypothetical protein